VPQLGTGQPYEKRKAKGKGRVTAPTEHADANRRYEKRLRLVNEKAPMIAL